MMASWSCYINHLYSLSFSHPMEIWDLIVSVPDHCLSFYFLLGTPNNQLLNITGRRCRETAKGVKKEEG